MNMMYFHSFEIWTINKTSIKYQQILLHILLLFDYLNAFMLICLALSKTLPKCYH